MAPLFDNAHEALTFAYRFTGQHYAHSRLDTTPPDATGKGLGGLDGAGQAGMIQSAIKRLGRITEAIIIARYALPWSPCTCGLHGCTGRKVNRQWCSAIMELSGQIKNTALAGCRCSAKCRMDYVYRYFSPQKEPLSVIARREKLHRNSAIRHYKLVTHYFRGAGEEKPSLESAAYRAAENRLTEIGIIGTTQG